MGTVIRFPIERRMSNDRPETEPREGSASITILPVVRIERHRDAEAAKAARKSWSGKLVSRAGRAPASAGWSENEVPVQPFASCRWPPGGAMSVVTEARAERRIALVIGNSGYAHAQALPNSRSRRHSRQQFRGVSNPTCPYCWPRRLIVPPSTSSAGESDPEMTLPCLWEEGAPKSGEKHCASGW